MSMVVKNIDPHFIKALETQYKEIGNNFHTTLQYLLLAQNDRHTDQEHRAV